MYFLSKKLRLLCITVIAAFTACSKKKFIRWRNCTVTTIPVH